MKKNNAKHIIENFLLPLDILINGDRPWDIRVNEPDIFKRVMTGGSLALGESYMDAWWECDALDKFFEKILAQRLDKKFKPRDIKLLWTFFNAIILNLQTRSRAFIIGKKHYDVGNELFSLMLDKRMNYSCGFWDKASNLDDAQEEKLDLICKKLDLKPGLRVLDIGCGWGGFAGYAAEKYGVHVTGITVSKEQAELAKKRYRDIDVKIEMKDYRSLNEPFDKVVSVGMFEHVGYKNYKTFMNVVHRCLKPEGLFLLHTIGGNTSAKTSDIWINKYIFPNSMIPAGTQILKAAEGKLILEDWHSSGLYYDKTLMAWYDRFCKGWDKIKTKYNESFYRMWCYYLLSCAGSFRARRNQLWQLVFSKKGLKQVFKRP